MVETKYIGHEPFSNNVSGPSLDRVTIENCFYYLSLLERFQSLRRSMDDDAFKKFLIMAEMRYRYFFVRVELNREKELPYAFPLDIMFMWHAHALSPYRFQDDSVRLAGLPVFPLPLKAMHINDIQEARINWDRYYFCDLLFHEQNDAWTQCTRCAKDNGSSIETYISWRLDPTVALECLNCGLQFNFDEAGFQQLKKTYLSLANHRGNDDGEDSHCISHPHNDTTTTSATTDEVQQIKGMVLDSKGKIKSEQVKQKEKTMLKKLAVDFDKVHNFGELTVTILEKSKELDQEHQNFAKEVVTVIDSAYVGNPTVFSMDLLQAAERLVQFVDQALDIDWDFEKLSRGIRRYHDFLQLMHANPKIPLLPTIEIDIAWHTHMLQGPVYADFMRRHLERLLNHSDDQVPAREYLNTLKKTEIAWEMANRNYQLKNNFPSFPEVTPTELHMSFIPGRVIQIASEPAYLEYQYGDIELPEEQVLGPFYIKLMNKTKKNGILSAMDAKARKMIERKTTSPISYHGYVDASYSLFQPKDPKYLRLAIDFIDFSNEVLKRHTAYGYIGTIHIATNRTGGIKKVYKGGVTHHNTS
ncbi:hypothetical protein BDA99DRAFT_88511 [Phascolomyces articulosus]|uniref:Uncharacterized protein n=1 Tax=Phascolomyces articulosus TaxID=60185 RepID=A0AAD5K859_9FUNG|nr:hypothetical protein BDA99DRAFT_88511 [Phascolomyces articulosus]